MRLLCAFLVLLFPLIGVSATFTGKISTISINETNANLVFEVVDYESHESETCSSGWYKVKKADASQMSPATFLLQAYLNNKNVTVHSSATCAEVTAPASVNRVTLGASAAEVKALIEKVRKKQIKK